MRKVPGTLQPPGIYPVSFSSRPVMAAFSGREFPVSQRNSFLNQIQIDPQKIQWVRQVHGAEIIIADSENLIDPAPEADGLIVSSPGMAVGILTADCIPVFFWDPMQEVAGLAHAGWRGLKAGILSKMIQTLRREFESKPSTLQVALGPAICSRCYEVGEEFKEYFQDFYKKSEKIPGKGHVDILGAAKSELIAEGIPAPLIWDSGICPSCQNERFFSARKEKTEERIASVIQLR